MSDNAVVQPGLWEPSTLGALCEVDPEILGASTPRDYRFRYIDISSVSPLSISEELQETSFSLAPSRARKKVRRNDVLMATVRPNLKAFARVKGDGDLVASTGLAVLRARDGVSDPRFIEQALFTSGIESQIEGLVAGSNYPAITVTNVKRLKLMAPPLAEQSRIADLLSAVDEQIEAAEASIAKLTITKQGLASELIHSKAANVRLENVVEILDRFRVPVSEEERQRRPGNVPYYGANGLQGYIDKALFCEPLVLIAEDGGNFEQYAERPIAYRIEGPSWVNNHAHILKAKNIDPSYLFHSLEHKDITRFITGGTRSKLTQAELRDILLYVPDPTYQASAGAALDALASQISSEKEEVSKLRALKAGLLCRLLGQGEVSAGA